MILSEIFSKEKILHYITFHDTLNPDLWDENDRLYLKVENHLKAIVDKFYEYLEIPDLKIEDIIITGSCAAFSYTELSDVDCHLIVDMSSIGDRDFVQKYFDAKKSLWNKSHNITIRKYKVELYVEDINNPVTAVGIYSLMNGYWISKPKKVKPSINDLSVVTKTNDYAKRCDEVFKVPTTEGIENILDDLYRMRQAGLKQGGEWSTENLVFKSIRNLGYLDKLKEKLNELSDEQLTLETK